MAGGCVTLSPFQCPGPGAGAGQLSVRGHEQLLSRGQPSAVSAEQRPVGRASHLATYTPASHGPWTLVTWAHRPSLQTVSASWSLVAWPSHGDLSDYTPSVMTA